VRSILRRTVVALALIGLGWVAARAQVAAPDFEIVVNAPTGQTTVQCVRGCTLMWIARGINPNSQPNPSFTFSCTAAQGCSSSRVGGWLGR
jgi:hypothetical protein